ncbi:expressed unknown protein [Seminavis robusta]|uniref:Uncharacterized protein n=1 Tax=Seminavis robusta TaxID=568900 RepID=A0A9N8HPN5_9STRA|nr:expressed unknown protein [Seminavis robusta]|eukprot:Sro1086_g239760.1 n/a (695) ;mRNA; f:25476-27677
MLRSIPFAVLWLCLSLHGLLPSSCNAQSEDEVFVWSSTGGGWRAMFACVGYVNLFRQAGLFNQDSSRFAQIATNSGGAWFSTQLFYSPAFYQQTAMAESPQDLYDFTIQWMTSYRQLLQRVTPLTPEETLDDITNTSDLDPDIATNETTTTTTNTEDTTLAYLTEFFDLFQAFEGDWTSFIGQMLEEAAMDYGHQGNFNETPATAQGKALPNTDMLIQTALSPTARVRNETVNSTEDLTVYLGPAVGNLYTVPISAAYIVNDTFVGFQYATFDSDSSNVVVAGAESVSSDFDFDTWDPYFLYPGSTGSLFGANFNADDEPTAIIAADDIVVTDATTNDADIMQLPFGGAANVAQVASCSSAAVGTASPTIPSTFAHAWSQPRAGIHQAEGVSSLAVLIGYDLAVGAIYNAPIMDNVAVCGQWPEPCGATDGWFIDGGFVDNPSVAINVAQYHQRADANLTKTLKMVLTNTNQQYINSTYVTAQLQQYYATDFNDGIAPGEYIWIPSSQVPRRSAQFFGDTLSEQDLIDSLEPIEGSNMTTQLLTGTTIDNPAFGIRAGQNVQILVLNLNEPITTFIAGQTIINNTMEPLAEMARHIAANEELLRRVQVFFGVVPEDDDDDPTTTDAGDSDADDGSEESGNSTGSTDAGNEEDGDSSSNGASDSTSSSVSSRNGCIFGSTWMVTSLLLLWFPFAA